MFSSKPLHLRGGFLFFFADGKHFSQLLALLADATPSEGSSGVRISSSFVSKYLHLNSSKLSSRSEDTYANPQLGTFYLAVANRIKRKRGNKMPERQMVRRFSCPSWKTSKTTLRCSVAGSGGDDDTPLGWGREFVWQNE